MLVLDDVAVLDIEAEPVIVFELVIEGVKVEVVFIVFVIRGDRDADEEALDVLEPRTDVVPVGDAVVVFDGGGDLVYEGLAEFVLEGCPEAV